MLKTETFKFLLFWSVFSTDKTCMQRHFRSANQLSAKIRIGVSLRQKGHAESLLTEYFQLCIHSVFFIHKSEDAFNSAFIEPSLLYGLCP